MERYVANPVEVDAGVIVNVEPNGEINSVNGYRLTLDDGDVVIATPAMCSRLIPRAGDYWVVQSDGYIYLNPKDVFERKYHHK